jgi:hypothetical protein
VRKLLFTALVAFLLFAASAVQAAPSFDIDVGQRASANTTFVVTPLESSDFMHASAAADILATADGENSFGNGLCDGTALSSSIHDWCVVKASQVADRESAVDAIGVPSNYFQRDDWYNDIPATATSASPPTASATLNGTGNAATMTMSTGESPPQANDCLPATSATT